MRSVVRAVLASLLAVLVVMLPGVGAAHAHDELTGSDPAAGSTVEPPEELVLNYSGQISQLGAQVMVTGDDGTDIVDGEPQTQGSDLIVPLADDVPAGDYEVVWRVTSEDGHPISGTFEFAVSAGAAGAEEATAEQEATAPETSPDPAAEDTQEATATTQEAPQPATEPADEPVAPTEPAEEQTATDTTSAAGMPTWVWIAVGLAVVALVALLARTWSRDRR